MNGCGSIPIKFYLWARKWEFHMIFMCHKIKLFFWFLTIKNGRTLKKHLFIEKHPCKSYRNMVGWIMAHGLHFPKPWVQDSPPPQHSVYIQLKPVWSCSKFPYSLSTWVSPWEPLKSRHLFRGVQRLQVLGEPARSGGCVCRTAFESGLAQIRPCAPHAQALTW